MTTKRATSVNLRELSHYISHPLPEEQAEENNGNKPPFISEHPINPAVVQRSPLSLSNERANEMPSATQQNFLNQSFRDTGMKHSFFEASSFNNCIVTFNVGQK